MPSDHKITIVFDMWDTRPKPKTETHTEEHLESDKITRKYAVKITR